MWRAPLVTPFIGAEEILTIVRFVFLLPCVRSSWNFVLTFCKHQIISAPKEKIGDNVASGF